MRKSGDHGTERGELHRLAHRSDVLAGNLLGDPTDREVHVYTPAGRSPQTPLPLLVDLVGFTSAGPAHTNWKAFGENLPERPDITCLMICAMAASYDPDPASYLGIRLPVDLHTAALIPERWANWLAHDPALIAADHKVELGHLKGIWLDCGTQDEFNIQFGMRRVSAALKAAGIAHVHEEFEGGHFDIDYRQDKFLPWMAKLLSA